MTDRPPLEARIGNTALRFGVGPSILTGILLLQHKDGRGLENQESSHRQARKNQANKGADGTSEIPFLVNVTKLLN